MHVRWCPLRAPPPCPTCRICTTPCPPGSPPWPQRITATRASWPTVVSRRGRFGERNSDRRGAAPLRASGHARRRRARTHAAYVSRHGHPVVDGRVGAARRAVQRDPRPGPRAPAAVDAVGRLTRAENVGPQRIATVRRATRRETGRHSRPRCAILRLAGQRIHIGRSEAPTAARHVRPVGNRSRCGRPRRSGTVGSNRGSRPRAVCPRPSLPLAVGSEPQLRRRIRAEPKRCCRCMAAPTGRDGRPSLPARLLLSRRDERLVGPRRCMNGLHQRGRPRRSNPTRPPGRGKPGCGQIGRSCLDSGRSRPRRVDPPSSTWRTPSPPDPSSRRCNRASSFPVCRFPRAAREVDPGCRRGCRWCLRRRPSAQVPSWRRDQRRPSTARLDRGDDIARSGTSSRRHAENGAKPVATTCSCPRLTSCSRPMCAPWRDRQLPDGTEILAGYSPSRSVIYVSRGTNRHERSILCVSARPLVNPYTETRPDAQLFGGRGQCGRGNTVSTRWMWSRNSCM